VFASGKAAPKVLDQIRVGLGIPKKAVESEADTVRRIHEARTGFIGGHGSP
jgi:hypothetical protein